MGFKQHKPDAAAQPAQKRGDNQPPDELTRRDELEEVEIWVEVSLHASSAESGEQKDEMLWPELCDGVTSGMGIDIAHKVRELQLARDAERARQFKIVVGISVYSLMLASAMLFLSLALTELEHQTSASIASLGGYFFLSAGLVLFTTCPGVDVDEILNSKWMSRVLLGLLLVILSFVHGLIRIWGDTSGAIFGLIIAAGQRSFRGLTMRVSTASVLWLISFTVWHLISSLTSGELYLALVSCMFLVMYTCLLSWHMMCHYKLVNRTASSPTMILYITLYIFLSWAGITFLVDAWFQSGIFEIVEKLGHGAACLVPMVLLTVLKPRRVFQAATQRMDSNLDVAERDGALVASLLDAQNISVGDAWWRHLESSEKDFRFAPSDPKHHFRCGIVTAVEREAIVVEMPPRGNANSPAEVLTVPLLCAHMPAEQLLEIAKASLRCIDWHNITFELMTSGVCGGSGVSQEIYKLSRPVCPGERIDFFLSHSWHDDAARKWMELEKLATAFEAEQGRWPTFWFDRVCTDQTQISDGLRTLPVNIMGCSKVLVLWGPTYAQRLWCVWELFMLVVFTSLEAAIDRLQIVAIQDGYNQEVEKSLAKFQLTDARCYDPNEESRIRQVIAAWGSQHFQRRIQAIGTALSNGGGNVATDHSLFKPFQV